MSESSTAVQSELDMKRKKEEVLIVYDEGNFKHDTGDVYDGFFEAKKKDRSVRMHGAGVYTTAEGDIYTGTWEQDKLVSTTEDIQINFVSGATYKGRFKDWCYTTKGNYTYPDESTLTCEFQENIPVGKIQLTDPNGHIWLGRASTGFGWVNPTNHYYDMLETTRDPSKIKKRPKPLYLSTPRT